MIDRRRGFGTQTVIEESKYTDRKRHIGKSTWTGTATL